ncbi:MAG: alpha/beta hydrolase family protein [Thermoguttaceae bacterium]
MKAGILKHPNTIIPMKTYITAIFLALITSASPNPAQETTAPAPDKWPKVMQTVQYHSPIDDSYQPAVFYSPNQDKPVPLLVSLHTWGGDYQQDAGARTSWCIKNKWAMIAPNFRGPNTNPNACGSDLAVADIVAAVDYAKRKANIETDRIYLIGGSGGGYAAMLLAGRHPEIWAGVSAWCGITDLVDWQRESKAKNSHYAKNIEAACGGVPGSSPDVDEQYRHRSSNTWIHLAKDVPLDLNHGIHDGHIGSVPVSHTIKAFNIVASPDKQITPEQIEFFVKERSVPPELEQEKVADPLYEKKEVLFRRISGKTRLTIFDGGHDSVPNAALLWLSAQNKKTPPVWNVNATSSDTSPKQLPDNHSIEK